nr:transposase [Corallococcus coralloides]
MALRLLSAGHAISRSVLNRFRASQGPFFTEALEETVRWASQEGLVEEQALAVDSVRLRAHASGRQVRVRKHSLKRLEALAQVDVRALSEPAQKHHDDEVQRHQQAVLLCQQRAAATVVLSNPCAGLMQFPGNGVHPGHRVTVVSSGVRQRLVVGVLLSASGNDKGHLARALQEARRVLRQAGLPASARLQVAADAGYWSEEDLRFAALNRDWVDVLLKESSPTGPLANEPGMLRREAFEFQPSTRAVVCPAGRTMQGPVRNDFDSCEVYSGVGCADCPQRARCTRGPYRKLTVRWDYERFRQAMRQRMSQPGAIARYNQRIATVEPVFASLEHDMRFRRLSSRHPPTVRAEVLLKLLAHNIRRLLTCSRLFCVRIVLDAPASLVAWQPASWPRYSAQTSSRTGSRRMKPEAARPKAGTATVCMHGHQDMSTDRGAPGSVSAKPVRQSDRFPRLRPEGVLAWHVSDVVRAGPPNQGHEEGHQPGTGRLKTCPTVGQVSHRMQPMTRASRNAAVSRNVVRADTQSCLRAEAPPALSPQTRRRSDTGSRRRTPRMRAARNSTS